MDTMIIKAGTQLSHAYMLVSPSAQERESAATRLAAAFLCRSGGDRPCGVCRDCRKALAHTHPDVIDVSREKDDKGRPRREISVGQIRAVVADAQIMPNEAARKVYVIHDAETMNAPAQNAMLKLLEEPPGGDAFILLASSAEGLLPTVRSRCARLTLAGDAQQDEEAKKQAEAFLAAAARHRRSALLRWSAAAEKMDGRQTESFVRAAREALADVLTGRSQADLSARECAWLDALLERSAAYLKLNTGVKHVLGLLAADGMMEEYDDQRSEHKIQK